MSFSDRQAGFEYSLQEAKAKRDRRRVERGQAQQRRRVQNARPERVPRPLLEASERWHRQCEVCDGEPAAHAHHCVREQLLRRFARTYGFDYGTARFDVRNRLWVCESCHEAHHRASRRVPLSALPARVWEFAREHKLDWALEREYRSEAA